MSEEEAAEERQTPTTIIMGDDDYDKAVMEEIDYVEIASGLSEKEEEVEDDEDIIEEEEDEARSKVLPSFPLATFVPSGAGPTRGRKLRPGYKEPKLTDKVTQGGPRVQRLQKSYIVRDVPSFIPTEIYRAAGAFENPRPIPEVDNNQLRTYMGLLRKYAGFNPANLSFEQIEDRLLMSSKARDESESEHFQRLFSSLRTIDDIKMNRLKVLVDLIEEARKDVNDERQHKRYSRAIGIKEEKGRSDSALSKVKMDRDSFELAVSKKDEAQLGDLRRRFEALSLRYKIADVGGSNTPLIPDPGMMKAHPTKVRRLERERYINDSLMGARTAKKRKRDGQFQHHL